jgi:GT2 family glycosyltransferase
VNAVQAQMRGMQEARGRVKFVAGDWQAALQQSAGDFVLALDAGSQLAADALFHIAGLLNERPDAGVVYFDDDVLDADGATRRDPFFKPDWSPELLLSVNYLRHAAVRRSLAVEAGGFDAAMGAAQEWDLMLRCAERTSRIHHLPAVLCHRRQNESEPKADDSGPRAVAAHLRRRGTPGAVAALDEAGRVRVSWPTRGGRVSVIIPTKDKAGLLEMCLTSLDRLTEYRNFEVILVDNGSRESATHRYYERLAADERVRIIEYRGDAQGRFNYSAANNLGARHATGELLLFLNNDIEVLEPGWLTEMVRWAERPEIGMVGATLLFPQGRIQHAGVTVGMGGVAGHVFASGCEGIRGPFGAAGWYRNYLAVTGACIMMRRDVFEGIGRFDEGYQLAFSDIELGLRAVEHGYRVLCTPFARLRHHEGGTRRRYTPEGDILRAFHRMGRVIAEGDPFYNPNLSYRATVPRVVCARERTPPEIMAQVVDRLTARLSGRDRGENPHRSIPDPQ